MKKLFLVPLIAVLVVGLVLGGCSKPAQAPVPTPIPAPTPSPTPTPTPAPATPTPTPAPTTTPPAPAQPKTLKFSYTTPKGIGAGKGWEWFIEEFGKRTNGRYKVESYPANTLVPSPAVLDSVRKGVAEIANTSTGQFAKDFVATSVTDAIPTLAFPHTPEGIKSGWKAWWELYNGSSEMEAEFKDFHLIGIILPAPQSLVSKKKEIHYPADLKALRVGSSGMQLELVKQNGGAAVTQVPPDAYLNMDKGVVDACFLNPTQIENYKMAQIADYFYDMRYGGGCMPIIMNLKTWNAMSPGDQKIFNDTWLESTDISAENMVASNAKGLQYLTDAGKKYIEPTAAEKSAWLVAMEPLARAWRDNAISMGVDSGVAANLLEKWKELVKKYSP